MKPKTFNPPPQLVKNFIQEQFKFPMNKKCLPLSKQMKTPETVPQTSTLMNLNFLAKQSLPNGRVQPMNMQQVLWAQMLQ